MIWEHSQDGEDDDEIAEVYGLTPRDVAWALAADLPRWPDSARIVFEACQRISG